MNSTVTTPRHFLDRSRRNPYSFGTVKKSDHKPKQPPKVTRMTIAAGFRCSGGVIFGADTYEAVGDLRDRVHKIPDMIEPYCRSMITGSCTDGHLMDAIVERIFDAIRASQPTTHVELGALLRDTLITFYREEIQVYPDVNSTDVALLIAAWLPAENHIEAWSTKSSVIRRMQNSEVLGVGVYVRYILRYLFHPNMPMNDAALAMTLLLSFAKNRVSFVGGDSYIAVLTPHSVSSENATLSSRADEELYDFFLEQSRRVVLATGNKSLTDQQYDAVLSEFAERLKVYRQRVIRGSSARWREKLVQPTSPPQTTDDSQQS